MRDILFRGKAINRNGGYHRTNYKNGDWVYGLLISFYDARFKNLPAEMTNTDGVSNIHIDYKTVGQYTGLTDKNGEKIFEGDIVDINRVLGDSSQNGVVEYGEAEYIIKLKRIDDNFDCWARLTDWSSKLEVIGNIHDNPKLLEV